MDTNISNKEKADLAIEKIHSFQKFGSILGLERMTVLLGILGNPQDDLKVIHVAGTNGKGSICKYIYSMLREAGYKVGLYTSPFLQVFNERIELDGEYISDGELSAYTEIVTNAVDIMIEEGHQSPTEFEVITAIALLYFKEKACDFVILEVGLGGRGDSTNVCKEPLATVIASISYDHMDRLGNTLGEIAWEKAGIIKEGCPVITSAESREALDVIEEVAHRKQTMFFETANIPYTIESESLDGCKFNTVIQGIKYDNLEISMIGDHQIKNAIAAIATIDILEENGHITISNKALFQGLKKAKMNGRFEVFHKEKVKPVIIIDGAHNEDGARSLNCTMNTLCAGKKILLITGMLADKETDKIIQEFLKISEDFICTEPLNPRKMSCNELKKKIDAMGGKSQAVEDYKEAFETALAKAEKENYDVLLCAGSLYLIGAIRSLIEKL